MISTSENAGGEVSEGSPALSLVTYNIHGCIGTDGLYDPPRIASVLSDMAPDVAVLQEVDTRRDEWQGRSQLEYLAESLNMEALAGPTIREDKGFYGNAILTSLEIADLRMLDLSYKRYEPRGALEATVKRAGSKLRIIATHFGLRARERLAQAERLMEWIEMSDGPFVLAGDMNEWFPLSRTGLYLLAKLGPSPGVRTYPSRIPLFGLDRIWARPRTMLRGAEAYTRPPARKASDHLPLKAKIDV